MQELVAAKEEAEQALTEGKKDVHDADALKEGLAEAEALAERSARAKADAENKVAVLEEQVGHCAWSKDFSSLLHDRAKVPAVQPCPLKIGAYGALEENGAFGEVYLHISSSFYGQVCSGSSI